MAVATPSKGTAVNQLAFEALMFSQPRKSLGAEWRDVATIRAPTCSLSMGQAIETPRYSVLVVEDDPLLLMNAMDLVEDAGFHAYGAGDAEAAIALMEVHPDIRVLFTDIQMPGSMDGLKLAQAVRARWPPVMIIVTSGQVKVGREDLPADGLFFAKPYAPAAILEALGAMSARISGS
jgi:CheY-like chemotaxis protein